MFTAEELPASLVRVARRDAEPAIVGKAREHKQQARARKRPVGLRPISLLTLMRAPGG
jgi:hypothetical protein